MRWIGARPLRRAAAVRETSERGYGNQPYEHWDREHDAGGAGVEPLSLQPCWEERHDDSGKPEESRVKGCEPPGEPVGSIAGSEALPSNRHPGDGASQVRRPAPPPRALIEAHGEGGQIVSTASIAGLVAGSNPAYNMTKCGVVALSEGLRVTLAPRAIGVSVVCPGFIRTQIMNSRRNLPQRFGAIEDLPTEGPIAERIELFTERISKGIDPFYVGELVREGIEQDWPYIFTDNEFEPSIDERFAAIKQGFDRIRGRDPRH